MATAHWTLWLAAIVAFALPAAASHDWSGVDAALLAAIGDKVFPGCAAAVRDSTGALVYFRGVGNYTYGALTPVGNDNPAVNANSSLFDMASISKIVGGTTISAWLYQRGLLDLDMRVADASLLGAAYANNGKDNITIRDLLMHRAGYPPDPTPGYSDPSFGCPATALPHPPLTFNCSERIFAALLTQTLAYPPRSAWLYSDLSLITMQYVIGAIVRAAQLVPASALLPACAGGDVGTGLALTCYFEALLRTVVLPAVPAMTRTQYLLPRRDWPMAVPTWDDPVYRHEGIQGVVSDENAYALGGIAGHAGVFSTAADMDAFIAMWQFGGVLNASTRAYFTTNPDPAFGPRALGWVTQAPTDTYRGCGNWSDLTFYHTGYTGTLICADPTRNITATLLTNRVYPNSTGNMPQIQAARQAFANAVLVALGY